MSDDEPPGEPPPPTFAQFELLEDLGKLAREGDREVSMQERQQWAEWDALAAGTLGPAGLQRLRDQAEQDDELHARWEAFRPLGDDLRAKIAGLLERRRADLAAAPATIGLRRTMLAVGGLALAAVAALAVLPGGTPAASAEPVITSELSSGERAFRGAEGEAAAADVPGFLPETRLEWSLRPDRARPGVEAEAFVEVDGVREAWTPPLHLGESGGVLIRGSAGVLLGDRLGRVTIGVTLRWPDGNEVVVRERVHLLREPTMPVHHPVHRPAP